VVNLPDQPDCADCGQADEYQQGKHGIILAKDGVAFDRQDARERLVTESLEALLANAGFSGRSGSPAWWTYGLGSGDLHGHQTRPAQASAHLVTSLAIFIRASSGLASNAPGESVSGRVISQSVFLSILTAFSTALARIEEDGGEVVAQAGRINIVRDSVSSLMGLFNTFIGFDLHFGDYLVSGLLGSLLGLGVGLFSNTPIVNCEPEKKAHDGRADP
jgi:hypothetical protein